MHEPDADLPSSGWCDTNSSPFRSTEILEFSARRPRWLSELHLVLAEHESLPVKYIEVKKLVKLVRGHEYTRKPFSLLGDFHSLTVRMDFLPKLCGRFRHVAMAILIFLKLFKQKRSNTLLSCLTFQMISKFILSGKRHFTTPGASIAQRPKANMWFVTMP